MSKEKKFAIGYRNYYNIEFLEEQFDTEELAAQHIEDIGSAYDSDTVFVIYKLYAIAERSKFNIRKVEDNVAI